MLLVVIVHSSNLSQTFLWARDYQATSYTECPRDGSYCVGTGITGAVY